MKNKLLVSGAELLNGPTKYRNTLQCVDDQMLGSSIKITLKEEIKHKIDIYAHQSWIEEGSSKSSLAYLMTALSVGSTGVGNQLTTVPVTSIVLLLRCIYFTV